MNTDAVIFRSRTQTSPGIFVGRSFVAPGHAEPACYTQWVISLTLAGGCRCRMGGGKFDVRVGSLTVLRPDTNIRWRTDAAQTVSSGSSGGAASNQAAVWECVSIVFHARPHWIYWLDELDNRDGFAVIDTAGAEFEVLKTAFESAETAYSEMGAIRDDRTLHELEEILLILRARMLKDQESADERVTRAAEIIHERMAQKLTVSEIAAAVGLSAPRLSTLFSKTAGVTPAQYIERVRLTRAAELLRFGSDKIGVIADAVGFSEPNYFARRFRLHYAVTPQQYRSDTRPSPAEGAAAHGD